MFNRLNSNGTFSDPWEDLDYFERQVLRECGAMGFDELIDELVRMRNEDDYNYRLVMGDEYFAAVRNAKNDSDANLREENRRRYSLMARYLRGKALTETFALLPVALQNEVIEDEKESWLIRLLKRLGF